MPEQQTNPQGESPRSLWDIGKGFGQILNAEPTDGGEEEQPEQQELEASEAPEEGQVVDDEQDDEVEASGGEEADPEDEQTSEDEPFMVLRVDGQEIKIDSLEEAIPLAQKGMHYTQEMQRLREEQRGWQAEREAATQTLRQKEQQTTALLQTLNDTYGFVLGEQAPDWSSQELQQLKSEKPQEYVALREQWDQLNGIRAELGRRQREQQAEQQKNFQEWVTREQEALTAKVPEWTEMATRSQDFNTIRDYANTVGITEQELGQFYDHRIWMVLRDAARYRQAEAAGKKRTTGKKSKTLAPGTGKGVKQGDRRMRAERDKLAKTGDPRAAGNILQELMTRPRK